jgi:hypothetical protein
MPGVNLTPALTPHNPMGLGYGGYLTRPYGYREGQQPSQLIHSWARARESRCFAAPWLGSIALGQTNPDCSYYDGSSVAIFVSAASTWLTTMLVQMSPWIGHRYVTRSTPSRVG